MRRATPLLVVLVLVVSTLAAVPAATMAQETETVTEQADESTTPPGAQLAGVVSVQGAEIDGEVQSRTFGVRVARANTNDAKAAVVADQLNDSESRLEELQQRKQALEQARENGSMSEGEYRAKAAQLHAETKTVQRLANETNETASQLPAEALEKKGIDPAAIRTLSQRASELSGPEVAAIAQGIAGPNVGQQARPDGAGDRGGDAADRTEAGDRPGAGPDRTPASERTDDTDTTPANETATSGGDTEPPGGGSDAVDAGQ
ncbi:hypothetical protein SAMN05443574_102460 [Haloarcula vallismortis]|uniref:Uncharacterized protein n=2 Tax=Haloarcula vallismortis TaxID=28442 RepID=M0J3K3_HALVA|nr:hypothetical protein [Haloarcula vallismortis]EMA03727.1 hypothetical protein C437_14167 [Haloarcula vallismortis ATCC 29715]SDW33311.1 hypothetical protein SAMN05443574_102460 [Haloarcula vallismortis]